MQKFFQPRSVVIVGASNSLFNLGFTIVNVLVDQQFNGKVFSVNSKGEFVMGCPGFKSILEIPEAVDLAIILIAVRHVPGVMEQCGKKGIKNVIIESAGFAENGDSGMALQHELDAVARCYGIRYMGPNCFGVVSARNRFCCFFGGDPRNYDRIFQEPGTLSYVVQSGGIGAFLMESLDSDVASVNKVVSIGNKADVDEADLIDYFQHDETEVIGMYLENFRNGRKLIASAKKSKKPIMVFKVGRTAEGSKAAMSHTAGMANDDKIFEYACRQAGIIRLKSIKELHSLPKVFTTMPVLKGKRIAIFTNTGAFGGITADIMIEEGLQMAQLANGTQQRLRKAGQLFNASNPVDLGPGISKQAIVDIFEILLSASEVDGLISMPNIWHESIFEAVIELVKMCRIYQKPAAIHIPNSVERIISVRKHYRLPLFESPEEAVRALSVSYQYYKYSMKKNILSGFDSKQKKLTDKQDKVAIIA